MADREVRVKLTFDGSEAERGLGRVADAAQRAGQAVGSIGQGAADPLRSNPLLDDIFLGPNAGATTAGPSARSALQRPLTGDVLLRHQESQRNRVQLEERFRMEEERYQAGQMRESLGAQRNRVRLEEQFRIEEERYQGGQARESLGSQRNRVRLEEQMRRDEERFQAQRRREFERTDPEFLARRGIEARQRRAAVRAEMEELDPELRAEREAREGRWKNPLAGTGLARLATPLFLAHAAGQMVNAAGQGLEDAANPEVVGRVGDQMAVLFRRMAEGIPIIGGFTRGLEQMGNVLSGTASALHQAAEFAEVGGRRTGAASEALSIRTAGGQQINQLQQRLTETGISSATAARTLTWFERQPDFYTNPIAVAGMTTGREGGLELAAMQARVNVLGSEDVVESRANAVAVARTELAEREARATGIRGGVARDTNAADMLDDTRRRAFDKLWTWRGITGIGYLQGERDVGAVSGIDQQQAKLRGQAAVGAEQLKGAEGAVAQQAKIVQDQLTKLEEAQTNAAKARAEAKQRELDIDRNRLQLLDQQVNRGRGQEIQAGLMGPGQLEMLAQLSRQAKDQGILSLPPEFRQQLLDFVGEPAQEKLRQEMRANPAMQGLLGGIRGDFGLGPVQDLEGQQRALQEAVNRGILQNQANLQQAMEGAMRGVFDPLVDALKKAMEAEISKAAAKLAGGQIEGQLQGRGR